MGFLWNLPYSHWFLLSSAVWTDRLSKQHAFEVADVALGVRSGRWFGHQPEQPYLFVSDVSSKPPSVLFLPTAAWEPLICFWVVIPWKLVNTWRSQTILFTTPQVHYLLTIFQPSASHSATQEIKTQVFIDVFPVGLWAHLSITNFNWHLFGGRSSPVIGFLSAQINKSVGDALIPGL